MSDACLFHSFFGEFDFEDFITGRTQKKDFEWTNFDLSSTLNEIAKLHRAEDAENLTDSLQDDCLGEDEEPEETDAFINAFEEAEMHFRKQNYEKALALYGKAQKELPLISKTYLKLSVTFGKVDRNEQAVACAIAAFMLDPHGAECQSMYALAYTKMGYLEIGNKLINENPYWEEANFVKAVIRGLPLSSRRCFDDQDLDWVLKELVRCGEAEEKNALRCVFLLHHIRYHQWLNYNSKDKIAPAVIKFLAENKWIAKICEAAIHDFKATKHAVHCVLFSLFCLLNEICQEDESVAVKLWSNQAVQMFLCKIGVQFARDEVIVSTVQSMGIFGRGVVVSFALLISALVKHANVRVQMCKVTPFNEYLWYGLMQIVYFRLSANSDLFHHPTVDEKMPVLCLACTNAKPQKQQPLLDPIQEFFSSLTPTLPTFDFVGDFFSVFPLLADNGEIVKRLETVSFSCLEYTTHVFAILSAIAFYAELDDFRLTRKCTMMTQFWVKITAHKRIAQACGADVWFFFARKLQFFSRDTDVFKDHKIDLTQTFDVLLNLAGSGGDFAEIEQIQRSFSLLAEACCVFTDSKIAPKSTPATFIDEISCKALRLLNILCSKSPTFLKALSSCSKFSLSHIVLHATPMTQQREPSTVCLRSLKLLATLLKKAPNLAMDLPRYNEIATSFIVEVAFCMASNKTKNLEFIASACICLTRMAGASKRNKSLVTSSLKSCSTRPEILISKLVNLLDSSGGDAKKVAKEERVLVMMAIASFLAALSETDAAFRTAIASEPKFHNAIARLQSCMSDISM